MASVEILFVKLVRGLCLRYMKYILANVTNFVKIGLNAASKVFYFFSTGRLHGALGLPLPNLEAVAQAVFALRAATLPYYCSI